MLIYNFKLNTYNDYSNISISNSFNTHRMHNALLVLLPADPDWKPPADQPLKALLGPVQLVGPQTGDTSYLVGERFLEQVAFMGCAPDIRLEPGQDNEPFCHIRLISSRSIEFHHGSQTHTPRCKECGSPVTDWKNQIAAWNDINNDTSQNHRWTCHNCGHAALPWEYNWRRSAGFGHCFIEITNIFPREAIPQPSLLDSLKKVTGVDWHYFYQY